MDDLYSHVFAGWRTHVWTPPLSGVSSTPGYNIVRGRGVGGFSALIEAGPFALRVKARRMEKMFEGT